MMPEILAWSKETQQNCQEAMLRIKAGIPIEIIAKRLNIPALAMKQMLVVHRLAAKISVSDLLLELGLTEADAHKMLNEYLAIRGEVLWTKAIGPLSEEEKRYIDYMVFLTVSGTPPSPQELVKRFGMTGTMVFGQFMNKMTEVITSEQQRLLTEISNEGDPALEESIAKARAQASAIAQSVPGNKGSNKGSTAGGDQFQWSEAMRENCFAVSVWFATGMPNAEICNQFGVLDDEIKRLQLIALADAQRSTENLSKELNIKGRSNAQSKT